MRIVVTGGAGRLGRSLVAGLAERGHDVLSLDRAVSAAPQLAGAEQRAVDLTDADATASALHEAKADAVIHLAAIAVPPPARKSPLPPLSPSDGRRPPARPTPEVRPYRPRISIFDRAAGAPSRQGAELTAPLRHPLQGLQAIRNFHVPCARCFSLMPQT